MGIILTLTGPSLSGKTTLARELINAVPGARMVPSLTTRPRRASDIPGEYQRPGRRAIEKLRQEDRLLWCVPHGNELYATEYRAITDVLKDSNAIGIMILVPQVLPKLDVYLREFRRPALSSSPLRISVFLAALPEDVRALRARKSGRDLEELESRYEAESLWQKWAIDAGLGFHFIDNAGPIEESVARVRELLPVDKAAS